MTAPRDPCRATLARLVAAGGWPVVRSVMVRRGRFCRAGHGGDQSIHGYGAVGRGPTADAAARAWAQA